MFAECFPKNESETLNIGTLRNKSIIKTEIATARIPSTEIPVKYGIILFIRTNTSNPHNTIAIGNTQRYFLRFVSTNPLGNFIAQNIPKKKGSNQMVISLTNAIGIGDNIKPNTTIKVTYGIFLISMKINGKAMYNINIARLNHHVMLYYL